MSEQPLNDHVNATLVSLEVSAAAERLIHEEALYDQPQDDHPTIDNDILTVARFALAHSGQSGEKAQSRVAMTDRELLDRIRAAIAELDQLVAGADSNSKYHTKIILRRARHELAKAEDALVWHVEG